MNNTKHLRIMLVILAIALVVIPVMIVGITGNGFGKIVSHMMISLSILSLIGAIMLGADKKNKYKFYFKAGVSIGLLIVLVSLWI